MDGKNLAFFEFLPFLNWEVEITLPVELSKRNSLFFYQFITLMQKLNHHSENLIYVESTG